MLFCNLVWFSRTFGHVNSPHCVWPVNTISLMSSQSVNLLTLFLVIIPVLVYILWPVTENLSFLNQQKGGKLHVCGQTWICRKGESYMYVAKLESAERGKVTCMWPNLNQQKGGKLHVCGQIGISRKGESYMYVAKLESAERGKVTCMWPNWNQQKGGKLHVCGQTGISRKGESYMYVAKLESAERGKVTCMWPNRNQQKGGKLHVCGKTGIQTSDPRICS